VEDAFETTSNRDQIGRTEDFLMALDSPPCLDGLTDRWVPIVTH